MQAYLESLQINMKHSPSDYFTNPKPSTLIKDLNRRLYLVSWAEGQEIGTSEEDLTKSGYTHQEIEEAKTKYKPRKSDFQRRGKDWSFLSHQVVGTEIPYK